jgi:hypothetical protein
MKNVFVYSVLLITSVQIIRFAAYLCALHGYVHRLAECLLSLLSTLVHLFVCTYETIQELLEGFS